MTMPYIRVAIPLRYIVTGEGHVQHSALSNRSSPVSLTIATRGYSKKPAKNHNPDVVVCREEEC